MKLSRIQWKPLERGEAPGNPELGGWRPLPRHHPNSQFPFASLLEKTLKLLSFRCREFQYKRALVILTRKLST